MFEVREVENEGRRAIATETIPAGRVVHNESPLMSLSPELIEKYEGRGDEDDDAVVLAAMSYYDQKMAPELRERFLALYEEPPIRETP